MLNFNKHFLIALAIIVGYVGFMFVGEELPLTLHINTT